MNLAGKTIAAMAVAGTAVLGGAFSQAQTYDGQRTQQTLTTGEIAEFKQYFALHACIKEGVIAYMLPILDADQELVEAELDAATDRVADECAGKTGYSLAQADSLIPRLEAKYGDDLNRIYKNSLPLIQP